MKILPAILVVSFTLTTSLPLLANSQCDFDYNIKSRIAYSKGDFDVKNNNQITQFSKTHNNASTLGGGLSYNCGEFTAKYTHHSVIDIENSNSLEATKIINTYSFSHTQYGQLTFGKLTTPYKAAGKNGDPFWDTASGTTSAANNFGFSDMTRGFTERSVIYNSPQFYGFQLIIGHSGNSSDGDTHLGVEYKNPKSVAGLQYLNMGDNPFIANNNNSKNASRIYARHSFNNWLLTGSYENINMENRDNESFLNVSMQKDISGFGRLAASYGHVSDTILKLIDGSTIQGSGSGLTAGAFYELTKDSEIYFLTSFLDFGKDSDQTSYVAGFTYVFSI